MTMGNALATASPNRPVPSRSRSRVWRKLRSNPAALAGGIIVLLFIAMAIAAPLIAPYDPNVSSWLTIRKPPTAAHWMGTDDVGRDVLSRLMVGSRASLSAGIVSVAIALLIGVPFGVISGYYGGWMDAVISRVTEAVLACPFLILAIALAAFLGPSLTNAMIAIGISAAPIFARLARGQVLSVKTEDYVQGARAVGCSNLRIILRYILPNIFPPLLVQSTLTVATAIIAEASLSFLGLGQQPPDPSWGSMLNTAKNFITQAPWMAIWPGIAIFVVVFGFNILGDGLRDALDPRDSR
ncbi:glutathione ABC transporter permease GsiD [Skermanella stibiiresistens SB22]|uniref:Glutathione ABC transporter permease GsiD n=1 Tax=Skermanella stibiiresistens SB22 TaxID=1385369 RepID=W9GUX4_9PROT|nr:ABC transporter permease [Skermanella stibiiresistens]EWY36232.1 glutathione ABC transporter permease GsiD [Skermanella stibiiresistens SB22]